MSKMPEGSNKLFMQSSTAVDSPGLLALDLVGERSSSRRGDESPFAARTVRCVDLDAWPLRR